jgi:hypothetical protein
MNGRSCVDLRVPENSWATAARALPADAPWDGVHRCTLALATAVLAALLVAGCFGGPAQTSSGGPAGTGATTAATTTALTTAPPVRTFDGEAALEFVKGFALRDDGSPRYRMPGTAGQAEGAAYLWKSMDVPGWTRGWQNFTGADYQRLDRAPVDSYTRPPACSQADLDRVPTYPFHNLYASRGGDPGQPLVLLVAHWDSLQRSFMDPDPEKKDDPYPGANDGASGVGVLLQLMRELEGIPLPFGVGILFVDGEDGFVACYPLAGSLQFAQHPPLEAHRVLVLDMVGDPGARFVRDSASVESDPALVDLLWRHGHALGGGAHFPNTATSITDDHLAFIHAGIPAVDLVDAGRGFPPTWHTTGDTVDKLSPAMLALVGDVVLATLRDPQFHSPWPA